MSFAFDGTYTAEEWDHWHGRNVAVSEGGIRVAREPTPEYASPRLLVAVSPSFVPVDVDVDECGDLYVLTEAAEIHRYDHRDGSLRRLPCLWYPGADAADEPGGADGEADPVGIAVTEDSIYVADTPISSDGLRGQSAASRSVAR